MWAERMNEESSSYMKRSHELIYVHKYIVLTKKEPRNIEMSR